MSLSCLCYSIRMYIYYNIKCLLWMCHIFVLETTNASRLALPSPAPHTYPAQFQSFFLQKVSEVLLEQCRERKTIEGDLWIKRLNVCHKTNSGKTPLCKFFVI